MAEIRSETKKRKAIRLLTQFCAATVLLLVDLAIKAAVKSSSLVDKPRVLIPDVLSLQFTENTGAAWGAFRDRPQLLSVFVGVALIAIAVFACVSRGGILQNVCLTAIFAGGAANFADRIMNGFVTDYICTDFIDFPVFNFADCLIVVGCVVLMIRLIYDTVAPARGEKAAEHGDG